MNLRSGNYILPITANLSSYESGVLPISRAASVTLHLVAPLEALATFGEGWLSGGRGHAEGERKRQTKREGEYRRGGYRRIGRRVWVSVTWGRVGVRVHIYSRAADGFSEVAIAYEVKVRLHDSRAT